MTMISMVAQPMFWPMLSTVGATEPRRPSSPRSDTMAGAPVVAPNRADVPSSPAPMVQPTTMAPIASQTDPVVAAIRAPVSGPNRLMPRFAHMANWSKNRSGRGGSVVRTIGASGLPWTDGLPCVPIGAEVDVAIGEASLRRHYPVRFGRSADPRPLGTGTPPSQPTTWCELPKSCFWGQASASRHDRLARVHPAVHATGRG